MPSGYDAKVASPLVLAFHGAYTNGLIMEKFSGLSAKADAANFIVAYPNGTGVGTVLFFNAFTRPAPNGQPDDVKFTAAILDDMATAYNIDAKRVFATGMSNGGMMCHRLGAELADRIAAIAPVAGTIAMPDLHPARPIPVIEFHGTADSIVRYEGTERNGLRNLKFESVEKTIKTWVEADGCPAEPKVTDYPVVAGDDTSAKREVYGPGKDGTEVVLVVITGGGHTWPGRPPGVKFLGKSTRSISANDLIWDFFCQHPLR